MLNKENRRRLSKRETCYSISMSTLAYLPSRHYSWDNHACIAQFQLQKAVRSRHGLTSYPIVFHTTQCITDTLNGRACILFILDCWLKPHSHPELSTAEQSYFRRHCSLFTVVSHTEVHQFQSNTERSFKQVVLCVCSSTSVCQDEDVFAFGFFSASGGGKCLFGVN